MTFSPLDFGHDGHDEERSYEVEPEIDEYVTLRCINEACGFSEEWHPEVEEDFVDEGPLGEMDWFHVEDSLYCPVCEEPAEEVSE